MTDTDPVLSATWSAVGVATLNSAKEYERLLAQFGLLEAFYEDWSLDCNVHAILIRGAGGKAFCAGGDVKAVVSEMQRGRPEVAKRFFRTEYMFIHRLSALRKPHIAVLDGIIMGGGSGISMHGQFRIATERSVFAMPECAIGLFPDVGASHFLSGLRGELGTYLGLTGTRLRGFQLVEAGLATHLVSSARLQDLETGLRRLGPAAGDVLRLEALFSSLQEASADHTRPSGLLDILPEIDGAFRHGSVEAIAAALQHRTEAWARDASEQLRRGSPLSQKITLHMLRLGRGLGLAACLRMEFRMVCRVIDGPSDFAEGVSALLIDKRGEPDWRLKHLGEVSSEVVERHFRALDAAEELQLAPSNCRAPAKL